MKTPAKQDLYAWLIEGVIREADTVERQLRDLEKRFGGTVDLKEARQLLKDYHSNKNSDRSNFQAYLQGSQ